MPHSTAGVILAGGRAVRMSGVRKGLLRIGGKQVIQRLLDVYHCFFTDIRIAAREHEPYARFGIPVSLDQFTAFSSLNGIHTALSSVRATHVFVAACDAPFLQQELVELLLSRLTPEADVVVPVLSNNYYEPLCAIYSKRCLPHVARQLEREEFQIIRFFSHVNVLPVHEDALREVDPELVSFTNINNPEELRQVVLNKHLALREKEDAHADDRLGTYPVPRSTLFCNASSKRIR